MGYLAKNKIVILLLITILSTIPIIAIKNNDLQNNNTKTPIITINLSKQQLTFIDENGQKINFHCSPGKNGYETPKGNFKIYAKEEMAISYKYGNTPMPYTLWFFGGYGIHASKSVPNYPASHGCVRLSIEDAKWLFDRTPVNTPVIIY